MKEYNAMYALLCITLLVGSISASNSCPKAYSHCNLGKEGYINIHMVSHTHDDVGWLKTVDQYYYGSNKGKQEAAVQYVLDTVVDELAKDPNKRFVYVEIAYFWRWWNEQNDEIKQLVRTLVDEGRLEFVIGAWCMNDEANPYYTDMIDQQELGFRFILKEFGPCARPRAAWQIDPFGHSREQASLFAQFGFDGLFLGRIDYQDVETRGATKTREMLWQGSENLGDAGRIFTGVLPFGYGPPPRLCFDQYCRDDPIMDDPNLDEYNVDQKVTDFLYYAKLEAEQYKTSNLIMTMGSDFQYSNAHRWFKNLDKLIKYVNLEQTKSGSKVNIFYSTTACYLYSLNMANTTWPMKYDDFFPYAHRPNSFWTGYFTSRAALKFNVRRTSNYLQIVRQLAALGDVKGDWAADAINTLERAMGVAQHHDAVAGTEKQHVANDYAKRLWIGTSKCVNVINDSFTGILKKAHHLTSDETDKNNLPIIYCTLFNITECLPIENQDKFITIIYNPLSRNISSWISVPIVDENYQVTELGANKLIPSDIAPVYKEISLVIERQSKANNRLVFKSDLPPLGFKTYFISRMQQKEDTFPSSKMIFPSANGGFDVKNDYIQLSFDLDGNLNAVTNLNNSLTSEVFQVYCIYKSMPGNNSKPEFQASGAYIFRPLEQTPDCLNVQSYSTYTGKQFTEVHQVFNDWISQTIRLYNGSSHAEFEWQVGPIDTEDNLGKEVVIRFLSDLNSNSVFYTDANGREILTRKRDFRPTWNLNQTEPVSGNYYPVNSRIFIRDEASQRRAKSSGRRQLTLVNDRSQGGSSITDGSIEIMLHRRTLDDDSLGVGEPLNEQVLDKQGLVVNGVISLLFDSVEQSARLHRELSHRVNNRPLVVFSLASSLESIRHQALLSDWPGLVSLPPNLHLLTLAKEFRDPHQVSDSLLVRVEHFYEVGEDAILSQPVTINLRDVFSSSFNVVGIEELALGANMPVDELNDRLKWTSDYDLYNEYVESNKKVYKQNKFLDFSFTFNPMEIRTFRLFYLPN